MYQQLRTRRGLLIAFAAPLVTAVLGCGRSAAPTPPGLKPDTVLDTRCPGEFGSEEALRRWGEGSAFGGGWVTEVSFRGYRLVVVFRCHTSGTSSSEPFVFVERAGRWQQLLHVATAPWGAAVSVEGDYLVLWRSEGSGKPPHRTEWLRYNLAETLD